MKLGPRIRPVLSKNPCGIMIVGEAPGEQEELSGVPFIGYSGQELTSMLKQADIFRGQCHLTNVVMHRPPENKIENFLVKKKDADAAYDPAPLREAYPSYPWSDTYDFPPAGKGYLHPDLLFELGRLKQEIEETDPVLVIALGNTASWALMGVRNISKIRGVVARAHESMGTCKVLPTYHPAAMLRDWSLRPIILADLMKAKRESAFREIRRPQRFIHIEPELDDLPSWEEEVMRMDQIGVDVETARKQITCIGFGDKKQSFVYPFVDKRKEDYSYWPSTEAELQALASVRRVLDSPVPKVLQNGLYDLQYIWYTWGMKVRNFTHDTMLLQHSLYPTMPKSLGFLGSVHTDEASWKLMGGRATNKGEDE